MRDAPINFKLWNLAASRRGRVIIRLVHLALFGYCTLTIWPAASTAQESSPGATAKQPADDFDPVAACDLVIQAHNRVRAEAKRPALRRSSKLQASAERHAKDMAAHDKMTHNGSDGSSPFDRIKDEGYQYRRAGENVAVGRFETDRLMKGWMESPHHKRNILGSFSQIGVACATAASGKRYWCVTFGLPTRR
jgi:uncharacterized protein YkwD